MMDLRPTSRTLPAWLLLVGGLLAALAVTWRVCAVIEEDALARFNGICDEATTKLRERLESLELIARGGSGVFAGSANVTREEWQEYLQQVGALEIVPGIQGISYAPRVSAAQLDAHIATARAEGVAGYQVWPPGPRADYAPVMYIEPLAGDNLRVVGFDLLSEPVRRSALERAAATGASTLSGRVNLVQATGTVHPGWSVLLVVPVYHPDMDTGSEAARRNALTGWVTLPLQMDDMVPRVFAGWDKAEFFELHVHDRVEAGASTQLFPRDVVAEHEEPLRHAVRTIDFHGHHWVLHFHQHRDAMPVNYATAWLTLGGGIIISVLLFALALMYLSLRERAQAIAERLTNDLRYREAAQREALAELAQAERIARVGHWKRIRQDNRMHASEGLLRILGLPAGSPALTETEVRQFFPPESVALLDPARQALEAQGTPYDVDIRAIRGDGQDIWLNLRAEALRDDSGQVIGVRGTAADITERRQYRLRIERLGRLYAALSACNAAVYRHTTESELFTDTCDIVVRLGGMDLAWIGITDRDSGRVLPVASAGEAKGYLEGLEISARADDARGRGPTGTAVREGRAIWVEDFQTASLTSPWHARGAEYGWRGSAALPLFRSGQPVGALTFYSQQEKSFDEETRGLLEEMAASISFALDKLDAEREASAYQATLEESEQRFRSLIEQSIAGAFILQDDKVVYANPRALRILGYERMDEVVGLAPMDIVAAKDRDAMEPLLNRLVKSEIDRAEALFSALRKDGSLVEVGVNCTRAAYQSRPAVIGLLQDISDRKVAEDQIRRYANQLEHTFIQTVQLATTISEMRDAYTAGHEHRVAEIAVAIGREMGLPENTIEGLRVGGQLHDVGKITVPSEILAKPGRLNAVEYALIREHAKAGFDILKGVDFPWPIAQIALQHHERLDGSGYPQGLKGDAIILEARIMAVADVVESMASHRPYRPGLGIDRALAEIERGMGTIYDREAAEACLRLFREKGFVIPS